MNKEFKTILNEYNIEIEEKKSRFIAHIKRCETEEESLEFIEEISKKYRDATHNCYAYINGETKLTQRYNDDGEPQGTAGIPMLEVLLKEDLTNVAVVVTRYFGGIKLGASGLIRAYGGAVSEVIKSSEIIWLKNIVVVNINFDYTFLGKIDNYFEENKYYIKKRDYLEKVKNLIYVSVNDINKFKKDIMEITSANVEISEGETILLQVFNNKIIE